jgi:N-acetylmuramoyl-L-alanine amidase
MNYSCRKKNKKVKYIIIHYTGMKSLKDAYLKLSNLKSDVSTHYLISRKGLIYNLLCPSLKAWHSGKSRWKNKINLNDYSIGIELENKGHDHGYENFSQKQYQSINKLINFLCNNFIIKKSNIIYHSDISPNRKKDPGEKFYLNKLEIERFTDLKPKKNKYSIRELLFLYGFNKFYINKYRKKCILSVKRTLNYKKINSNLTSKFYIDFYNLLFH